MASTGWLYREKKVGVQGGRPATSAAMSRPRLLETARLFLRVGATAFGGGDPTIAILQREFYKRDWLSPDQFAISSGLRD